MFVHKKKKSTKSKKSKFSIENKSLTDAEKEKITKEGLKKALSIKQYREYLESLKKHSGWKPHISLAGITSGLFTITHGLGKACGVAAAAPIPALIGLGVVLIGASIGYLWLG